MTIKKLGDKSEGKILPEEDEETQKVAAKQWTPEDDELLRDELAEDE